MTAPRVTKRKTTVHGASGGSIFLFWVVVVAAGFALFFAVNWVVDNKAAFDGVTYKVVYKDTPDGAADGYVGSYGQPTATVEFGDNGIVAPIAAVSGLLLVLVGAVLVAVEATRSTEVEETLVPEGEDVTTDVGSVVTSILDFAKSARAPIVAMIAGLLIAGGGLWMTWSSMSSAGAMAEHVDEVVAIIVPSD